MQVPVGDAARLPNGTQTALNPLYDTHAKAIWQNRVEVKRVESRRSNLTYVREYDLSHSPNSPVRFAWLAPRTCGTTECDEGECGLHHTAATPPAGWDANDEEGVWFAPPCGDSASRKN